MTTELQSNVLSARTIRKALPSCMVYALVQSVTFMVDTIVAGHFLGSDAVAAVALGIPIIGLMISFPAMILQGGFLKMLDALGRSDKEDYRRIFSITLTFTLLVATIFVLICLFGTEGVLGIAGAQKATEAAVTMGRLYIRTACWMIFLFCMGTAFQMVMTTYGYQTDRTFASIICVSVNVVTSVLFIQFLQGDLKIAGLGIGSALGTLAQTITAYLTMRRKKLKTGFRFYPPNRQNLLDALDMMRRGLPSSVDNIMDSVSASIVNSLILGLFADGTAVLALVSIIKTMKSVVRTVGRGVFYADEPLVGILHGGRDNEGIKKAFTTSLRLGLMWAAGLAALIIVFQTPLLTFYNINDNTDAHIGLVLVALSGLVFVVPFAFNAVYEASGHYILSLMVAMVPDSILYPLILPLCVRAFGVTGVWLDMGFSFVPFFVVFYLVFAILNRGVPVPLERLLALRKEERSTALDVSIPTDAQSVTFVSEQLQSFFTENGAPAKVAYACALCMEEIAADYLEHRKATGDSKKKAYMDMKAFRDPEKIELVLRNYDEPYNPLVFEREEESFSKIGVTMVQRISRDITYSYAYHLNVVSVTIET